MKFPRKIKVWGYGEVTVCTTSPSVVEVEFEGHELELFAEESKALRKALRAAERLLEASE